METAIGALPAASAYLLGSVSLSYLLVRTATGEDVRQSQSRNAGTLNTYHRLGIVGGQRCSSWMRERERWPSRFSAWSTRPAGRYSLPLPWWSSATTGRCFLASGAATGYFSVCLAVILTGAEWQMVALSVLLAVMAGVTYLLSFRREIFLLARDRQWRRLALFRFVH